MLILAALPRDGELTVELLRRHGILARSCAGIHEICAGIDQGAVAVLLAVECLDAGAIERLRASAARQPSWSDIPLIVLTPPDDSHDATLLALSQSLDFTSVERPVRIHNLLTVVRSALRSRRRQYEVRDLLARLEQADRRRQEYLAVLAHELRHPISAARTAFELLDDEDGGAPDSERARARGVLARQLRSLDRMVDDLLDLERVARGKLELELDTVELGALVREQLAVQRTEASRKGQRIDLRVPRDLVEVRGDPVRLQQILANLVSNAIRYTPEGGRIEVRLEREDGEARLRVQDNGAGIPEDMLESVFEPFQQVRQEGRSAGGLGLGLSVVRSLARLHGGDVTARSEGIGKGSEFTVRLPLIEPTPDQARAAREYRSGSTRLEHQPLDVLVVEDDPDMQEMLHLLIGRWRHRVHLAGGMHEALEALDARRFDAVVSDIELGDGNGHALAREILSRSGGDRPYLIAMSGFGRTDDRRRSLEAGFDRHLVKPVDAATLHAALREVERS